MNINIKYFGLLAEVTQQEAETINFEGKLVSELLDVLQSKYPALKNKDFKVAQNQELVSINTEITGQEIAILPPFSGG
ncbi:MoaD/ThiS family protein [Flavobacteriaceae bacterium XHP0103]|uniref:MoaD/ThiS family protein n=1 Tax=Marixanthotalea marina TaxID=2844359 RepID=UPI00298A011A|nr:MoaD/ThiS family protein [Marixanthotalea marina]MBU3821652.1 MoaD/ThiS family protein [Marixanthotalea marina]